MKFSYSFGNFRMKWKGVGTKYWRL